MADDDSLFTRLRQAIRSEAPIALATVVQGPGTGAKLLVEPAADGSHTSSGTLGNRDLDRVVVRDLIGELAAGTSGVRHYGPNGEARQDEVMVFLESFAPPPQMLIFGAVDFTAALSRVGKVLGYRVTVCDARPVFATTQRFPYADEVVVDWPHRLLEKVGPRLGPRDAICVLTHDPKFDVPAVIGAIKTARRLHRGHGIAAHHRRPQRAAAGRGRQRRGPDPGAGPHRARHRRPHAGGDRHLHLRRDHRPPRRPPGPVAARHQRGHPYVTVTVAGVVLAAGAGSRFRDGDAGAAGHKLRADFRGRPVVSWVLDTVLEVGFNQVFVVTGAVDLADLVPPGVTEIHNPAWATGQSSSLQVAVAAADAAGHGVIVIGLGDQPLVPAAAWRSVGASAGPIVTATFDGERRPPVKLARSVWAELPTEGDAGARTLMQRRPELVSEIPCRGNPADIDTVEDLRLWS